MNVQIMFQLSQNNNQMIVNRLSQKIALSKKIIMRFGGGGHHVYDWRDDHVANPDYVQNVRMIGVKSAETYTFPHKSSNAVTFTLSHPEEYDPKNLHTNFTGCVNFGTITNSMEVPTTQYMADAAHQYDYESEDCDFQPQTFQSQHFRKKGPLWIWLIAGTTPLWFFASELFLQYWPEDDNWRYQRPPPLNYPDDLETPDTEYHEMFKSTAHKNLYDAGVVNAPFFDIIDGKKVYTTWAGVNQPRDPL